MAYDGGLERFANRRGLAFGSIRFLKVSLDLSAGFAGLDDITGSLNASGACFDTTTKRSR